MRPTRIGFIAAALLVGLPLIYLSPILFTYIGADIGFRARVLGEWAVIPAAVLGYLALFAAVVTTAGGIGAAVGHMASKALK
jgi:hypothetical protein